jgi:serine/threonine-protein kinase
MHAQALLREDAVQRFVREARVLFKLHSPHVARVLDVGNLSSGEPFIVMEYLEGKDLKTRLEQDGVLGVSELVRVGRQLLSALVSAHEQGILHRDLKPANLYLARDEHGGSTLKVLDFGISKLLGPDVSLATLTTESSVIGSPHYMAPEQMMSPQRADARSDLWSAGLVLYELASGVNPFDGETMAAICTRVLTAAPEPLSVLRSDVPEGLNTIVMRCLQKDADARFQSARELALALNDLSI